MMWEVNHQVQVASLVSATAPAIAYVSSPGQLSESFEARYEAVHNITQVIKNIIKWRDSRTENSKETR